MFAMFNNVFAAIGTLFQALQAFASALLHIAVSTERKAQAFSEEVGLEAQRDLDRIRAEIDRERASRATPVIEQQ